MAPEQSPPPVFTIDFDSCTGASAPTINDFGCTVSGCANVNGAVDGCTCTVTAPGGMGSRSSARTSPGAAPAYRTFAGTMPV